VLVIDTGSTIEWAKTGVIADSGAIVQATSSTFSNCRIAVGIYDYTNPVSSAANISFFTECNFLTTDTLQSSDHSTQFTFIKLVQVNGVTLTGNHFINTSSTSYTTDFGCGIMSDSSSFTLQSSGPYTLDGNGCGHSGGRQTLFKNLRQGIEDYAPAPHGITQIKEATFKNISIYGIAMIGSVGTKILKCTFLTDDSAYTSGVLTPTYIESLESIQFDVESNTFSYTNTTETGILQSFECYGTGRGGGTIRLNTFSSNKLTNSNLLVAYGLYLFGSHPNILVECNDFTGFVKDIAMENNNTRDFGSQEMGAGNVFHTNDMDDVNVSRGEGAGIYYYDPSIGAPPQQSRMTSVEANSDNPCEPICIY
jgi:hypothetical protein